MTQPLLRVESLAVHFLRSRGLRSRILRAAHAVSFDVQRGEVVALVGESGSGKSTIGRVVARLQKATEGRVFIEGQSVPVTQHLRTDPILRARIQMVFQDPYASLNPVHTILHHVARPLKIHGHGGADLRASAAALLDTVGLSPGARFLDRKPHELSGGQRQRVAIARALAPRPAVLVADEPTASLDVSVRMEVLLLLRKLQQEQGLGVLLITHDLAGARFISDRIVVLYAGQVMEQGPTEQVLRDPRHPYTQLLVAAASHRPGPLPADPGLPPVLEPPPGCPFAPRCRQATEACAATAIPEQVVPLPDGGDWRLRCTLPPAPRS